MPVFSQLERLNWLNKKIMPFITHEGNRLGVCERDLKKISNGAIFSKGLAVHGADVSKSESIIADWAKKSFDR